MRKFGLVAVVVGAACPVITQGCGGLLHTAREKQVTTAQSAPLQSKLVEQDKKG